ncbi:MAG: oxidoreductase molybdopterin binding [Myxococcales bacterium]|nr:oxidoreductase molybdopterin binding [Myxococcales bacterium]
MTRVPPSRRDAFRALAALGLVACDTSKPHKGALGRMERVTETLEGAMLSERVPSRDLELTPMDAIPGYHVAPEIPAVPDDWKLIVSGLVATPLRLTLADLRALPQIGARIRHHCVEGWSAVADWSGVAITEIAKLAGARPTAYVEFRSFDAPSATARGYWSSWDRASALHPDTMVALAMNGAPLTPKHGAPCRLYGSVKLGYKMVKYLTEISFLDRRTGGYWENQGYEWFAGV